MSEIIRELRQDHANIAKLLEVLERQCIALNNADTPDYDILLSIAEYFLTYPDQSHHVREDLVYHQLLLRDEAAAGSAGNLHEEHQALSQRVNKFAEVLEDILSGALVSRATVHEILSTFIDDQRRHMQREESRFFPAALATLTDDDWQTIDSQVVSVPDLLFGPEIDTRFAELHDALNTGEP